MSDSVDPMNSPEPLPKGPKPLTSIPSLAKVDTERLARKPVAAVLEKIRRSRPRSSRIPDELFRWIIVLCAASVFVIVVLVVWELVDKSRLSLHQFGIHFFYGHDWDPVNDSFGAMPFIFGTLVSSLLALLLAVPLSVGVAVYITEMCPQGLRAIISFLVELLAAIPSVIYGLWGIFVLAPLLRDYVEPFLARTLGWTGLFTGPMYGLGMLAAGIILAIMIVPVIASITREVMSAVPQNQREAVLALGATRWEMIRMGVLRNARIGIVGGVILGLGRALGETMAEKFPFAFNRRAYDLRIGLQGRTVDANRARNGELVKNLDETPKAHAVAVLVPGPVRHVGHG